ncbi:MAG: pyridoxamine 5'-phosphate oxidase family protein [Candidatus Aminicenantes bacterium]|nr:pyridoxamine 5'-phosphate oxidase family protein [Candidatus Aminicenantes bacterium]
MTRNVGTEIPDRIIAEIRKDPPVSEAVPLLSVDPDGYPHVALLSYFELFLQDGSLCFFVHGGSRTGRFLKSGRRCTLLFVNRDYVVYVKGRARWQGDRESCSVFQLQVEAVLEDSPLPEEGDVFLRSGIRFGAGEEWLESRVRLRRRMVWN